MNKVLIVSKTRLWHDVCIGGLVYDTQQNVRLLRANGEHQLEDTPYEIWQIWNIDYTLPSETQAPHIEDVWVTKHEYLRPQLHVRDFLLASTHIWRGHWHMMFDKMLRVAVGKSGYIAKSHLPMGSVGFWIPDLPLECRANDKGKPYYWYGDELKIPYVGLSSEVPVIPAGTLLRVSLARWWQPDKKSQEQCYLQLSGWY